MKLNEVLANLGLSDIEIQCYLAVLRLGGGSAPQIAKEMEIQRTRVYPILKKLARQNILLVYFRQGNKYYHAVNPEKLLQTFEKKVKALAEVVPELASMESKEAQQIGLRFAETKAELRKAYLEAMLGTKKKETILTIGNIKYWQNLVGTDFAIKLKNTRKQSGKKIKIIAIAGSEGNVKYSSRENAEIRFLPSRYKFASTLHIYKDKVILCSTKSSTAGVIIEIPAMVDIFNFIFEVLWQISTSKK